MSKVNAVFALDLSVEYETISDRRFEASLDPFVSYEFARRIDKSPNIVTRASCNKKIRTLLLYSKNVDKSPRKDTRDIVLEFNPLSVSTIYNSDHMATLCYIEYSIEVDKVPRISCDYSWKIKEIDEFVERFFCKGQR